MGSPGLRIALAILVVLLPCLSGCMSWKPGWQEPWPSMRPGAVMDGEPLEMAERLTREADTAEEVERLVALYDAAVEQEPGNLTALRWSANYRILLGAAYAEGRSEKRRHWREALQVCERAMATNPEFRALVDAGEPAWTACRVLTAREADAMGDWATAVFYYFKEGVGLSRLANFRWIRRAQAMMDRLDDVVPHWSHGGSDFSRGIVLLALPKAAGGDEAAAAEALAAGLEAGPSWLLHRWGRAKYFHVKYGNRQGFLEDLEWVLAQEPHAMDSPYPWNVYFQRDAQQMLEEIDRYF